MSRSATVRGSSPAATTAPTSVLRVMTPTSVPSSADTNTARVSGLSAKQRPASWALARSDKVVGSDTIASRMTLTRAPRRRRLPPGEARLRRRLTTLAAGCCAGGARSYYLYCPPHRPLASFASVARGTRVSRVDPPRLERARDLADRGHHRRLPERDRLLFRHGPHAVECIGHLVGELDANLVAVPEQPAEILHPLEVGHGHTAGVREDVRDDGNATVGEDRVGLERRRAVRALDDELRMHAAGVFAGELVLARRDDEHVACELEQLVVRDPLAAVVTGERAVLGRVRMELRNVETVGRVQAAGDIGDGDDARAA